MLEWMNESYCFLTASFYESYSFRELNLWFLHFYFASQLSPPVIFPAIKRGGGRKRKGQKLKTYVTENPSGVQTIHRWIYILPL